MHHPPVGLIGKQGAVSGAQLITLHLCNSRTLILLFSKPADFCHEGNGNEVMDVDDNALGINLTSAVFFFFFF